MLKSKRFLVTLFSAIIFIAGTFFFKVEPVALAGGLALIFAPYIAGQSYRSSAKDQKDTETLNTEK